jgi:hypothetical protein
MANDINDAGVIVGYSRRYDQTVSKGDRAIAWTQNGTVATELQHLGLDAGGATTSEVFTLNQAGTAVGSARKHDAGVFKGVRPVRWNTATAAVTELGILGTDAGGVTTGKAYEINALGHSVGYVEKFQAGTSLGDRAVLWLANGTTIDLTQYVPAGNGWTRLTKGSSISDTGWIQGYGDFDADGAGPHAPYARGFLMLVPEAGTYGRGDANFDTHIDFDDLLILAQHYGEANPTKDVHVGDLNLDGDVNFDDLLALAQHYQASPATLDAGTFGEAFAADWTMARALVPEPIIAVACLATSLLTRRRRR